MDQTTDLDQPRVTPELTRIANLLIGLGERVRLPQLHADAAVDLCQLAVRPDPERLAAYERIARVLDITRAGAGEDYTALRHAAGAENDTELRLAVRAYVLALAERYDIPLDDPEAY